MLLTGTHPRTLDDKKRLTLPKRIREQLGEVTKLFVTPGQDKCLWLFSQDRLERMADKLDESPATDKEVRLFRQLFFSQTEEVEVDAQGRILLPDRLIELGGLKHEVILLGIQDRMELWDAQRWQRHFGENAARFDTVAEQAFRKT
jgi:MraZ protein